MIRVFVGDEDSLDSAHIFLDLCQPYAYLSTTDTGIHQERIAACFDKKSIAVGSAG
jgi:hypothetical protein